MHFRNHKRIKSIFKIKDFIGEYGEALIDSASSLEDIFIKINSKFGLMNEAAVDIENYVGVAGLGKSILKTECVSSVWKLASVMKSNFIITNNTIEWNNIKMSETKLKRLSEGNFYIYSQLIMNLYVPATYTPMGINPAEMDELKTKLAGFPQSMKAVKENRLRRREADNLLNGLIKEILFILKYELDGMMEAIRYLHPRLYNLYKLHRRIGLVRLNKGKAPIKDEIGPLQTKVAAKHSYRNKLGIHIKNLGNTPLQAGLSINQTVIQGTPFIIEPGKSRRRISQKLGVKGEFFLIQNLGDEAGKYEVWIKE